MQRRGDAVELEWNQDALPVLDQAWVARQRLGLSWAELEGLIEEELDLIWVYHGIPHGLDVGTMREAHKRWTTLLSMPTRREAVHTKFKLSETEPLDKR